MSQGNGHHPQTNVERVLGSVGSGFNEAADAAAEATGLKPMVEKHPYAMVAAAFGVGYVLAGALFSPLTRRLVGLGIKAVMLPQVQNRLFDVAEGALDSMLKKTQQGSE